jgi:hypothetical protein
LHPAAPALHSASREPGAAAATSPPSTRLDLQHSRDREWLRRGRLTRTEIHALLVQGFSSAVGDVLRAVRDAI